jgi:NTE family protein
LEAHRKLITILLSLSLNLALSAVAGCSHAAKKPDATGGGEIYGPSESQAGPAETYGPPTPEASPAYGPEPVMLKPVVLVLGPGMARDFAASGVLHALRENKIPIGAIVASEFGSLVGALYAVDANLNHFDWALMHFKDSIFTKKGMFSRLMSDHADSSDLDEALGRAFGTKDLNQTKLPIRVALQPSASRNAVVVERGSLAEAVRAAIAVPELYGPGKWDGVDAASARETLPFPVAEARAMNLGPVIVVDTLEKKDEGRMGQEMKDADLVLEPDLNGIGYMDFNRKTEAAFRGRAAVTTKLAEIRHLVGMPETDTP